MKTIILYLCLSIQAILPTYNIEDINPDNIRAGTFFSNGVQWQIKNANLELMNIIIAEEYYVTDLREQNMNIALKKADKLIYTCFIVSEILTEPENGNSVFLDDDYPGEAFVSMAFKIETQLPQEEKTTASLNEQLSAQLPDHQNTITEITQELANNTP